MTQSTISKNVFDIPEDVDYVIVELVHIESVEKRKKNDKAVVDLERGLFIGFEVHADNSMFLCTTTNGKDLLLYNADHYNISMLEYGDDLLKYVYIYTDAPSDQGEAVNILGKLLEKFQNKNKVLEDKNLIDISQIKNYGIDKTVFETDSDNTNSERNRGGQAMGARKPPTNFTRDQYDEWEDYYMAHGGYPPAGGGFGAACGYDNRNSYTYPPKEPKAIFFKRKSAKPGKKKLTSMKTAVEEVIANKGYETKAGNKDAKKNNNNTNTNSDDNGDVVVGEVIDECANNIPI